jgi:hypothetical protein
LRSLSIHALNYCCGFCQEFEYAVPITLFPIIYSSCYFSRTLDTGHSWNKRYGVTLTEHPATIWPLSRAAVQHLCWVKRQKRTWALLLSCLLGGSSWEMRGRRTKASHRHAIPEPVGASL